MGGNELFTFPNPVNEVAARVVAGGVVILSVLTITLRQRVRCPQVTAYRR